MGAKRQLRKRGCLGNSPRPAQLSVSRTYVDGRMGAMLGGQAAEIAGRGGCVYNPCLPHDVGLEAAWCGQVCIVCGHLEQ